jgi:hypothetical protein
MKKCLLFLSFLLITLITVNAQQKVIPLYDGLHQVPKAGTGNEAENDNNSRENAFAEPEYLSWMLLHKKK